MVFDVVAFALAWHFGQYLLCIVLALVFVLLFLVFRDPLREVPAIPMGLVSPVDGAVTDIERRDTGLLGCAVHVITIRVNSLGTYTARCPVEGKIMDFQTDGPDKSGEQWPKGLWVRTDEDEDVVLQFHGHRFGIPPRAFARFGERLSQGQRCAYLRLTRYAEVQLPIKSRVQVSEGDIVIAGSDILAKLAHK